MTTGDNIATSREEGDLSESTRRTAKNRAVMFDAARLASSRQTMPKLGVTKSMVKDLTKQRGSIGNKLVKVGGVLVALPEPITGVIGVPLLITGAAMRRRTSANLTDVHSRIRETLTWLASESSYF